MDFIGHAATMERASIFVSYSHRDVAWLERVRVHLTPLERELGAEFWSDRDIAPGADWREQIVRALDNADVAILLVTADLLSSDFIVSEELPRLLEAAQSSGTTILPLIISPSRFSRMPGLSRFQAINDPRRPLISLSPYEQEEVLDRLSSHVEALLANVPAIVSTPVGLMPAERSSKKEVFTREDDWQRLDKIGRWSRLPDGAIQGAGMHQYLVSSCVYGPAPFKIAARLTFGVPAATQARSLITSAHPGIILGWKRGSVGRRYLNVLFTENRIVLEEIGAQGGDDFSDFRHLDYGAPFELLRGREYQIEVAVDSTMLRIEIDRRSVYDLPRPHDIAGRVGLRPWRTTVTISEFEVFDLQ